GVRRSDDPVPAADIALEVLESIEMGVRRGAEQMMVGIDDRQLGLERIFTASTGLPVLQLRHGSPVTATVGGIAVVELVHGAACFTSSWFMVRPVSCGAGSPSLRDRSSVGRAAGLDDRAPLFDLRLYQRLGRCRRGAAFHR